MFIDKALQFFPQLERVVHSFYYFIVIFRFLTVFSQQLAGFSRDRDRCIHNEI